MEKFIKDTIKKFPSVLFAALYARRQFPSVFFAALYARRQFEQAFSASISREKVNHFITNLKFDPELIRKEEKPRLSSIEITNACNLNCRMCNTKMSKRPIGFMDPQVFERILMELKSVGVNTVGFHTVGEPFVYKNLNVLLQLARTQGMAVWLSTNGQFPQQIEKIYREFSDIIIGFRFSIDGATRETYEMIRRGASFDKLLESLETIHRINGGKRGYRVDLTIDSILGMYNMKEVSAYFDIYSKYCYPEYINFWLIDGLSPDNSFFKEELPFPHLIRWTVPCEMTFRDIYFTYDGQVTLCCRDYNGELIVGDIRKKNIMEIWNGPLAETIREKHLNPQKLDIESCKACLGPSQVICSIVNEYIHFLIAHRKGLTPKQFGDRIVDLLTTMDSVIVEKDLDQFRESVLPFFKSGQGQTFARPRIY